MLARSRLVAAITRVSTVRLFRRADWSNFSFLQHAQQFHLHCRRHLADLIEKNRAAVCCFKESLAIRVCAGERTLHVTKQLRLEQCFGERAAVDRNERFLGARAQIVDRARDQFFSGARFAGDQHRRLDLRDSFDHLVERLHSLRFGR